MNPQKKKGLGRGLKALFGDQKITEKKKDEVEIASSKANISDLTPNKYQPRVNFDEKKLDELINSVKKRHYSAYSSPS